MKHPRSRSPFSRHSFVFFVHQIKTSPVHADESTNKTWNILRCFLRIVKVILIKTFWYVKFQLIRLKKWKINPTHWTSHICSHFMIQMWIPISVQITGVIKIKNKFFWLFRKVCGILFLLFCNRVCVMKIKRCWGLVCYPEWTELLGVVELVVAKDAVKNHKFKNQINDCSQTKKDIITSLPIGWTHLPMISRYHPADIVCKFVFCMRV